MTARTLTSTAPPKALPGLANPLRSTLARQLLGIVLALCAANAAPLSADIIHLRHGGTVEGEILEEGSTWTVRTRLGTVRIAAIDVASVTRRRTVMQRYASRLADIDPADIDARLALATWCLEQKHSAGAREQYEAILVLDSDHAAARAGLGHEMRNNVWITAAELARERQALRAARGKQQQQQLAAAREQSRLRRKIERWFRDIAYGSQARCVKAHAELDEFARAHQYAQLQRDAAAVRTAFDDYWRKLRVERDRALTEVRATHSKLSRPIRSMTTPLGGGAPVTIQLPSMQVTSIRTTIWIPAGRGK